MVYVFNPNDHIFLGILTVIRAQLFKTNVVVSKRLKNFQKLYLKEANIFVEKV